MNEAIKQTVEFVKKHFADDFSGHDWWHTYRVWQTAKKIARKEGGDIFIVEMAALLHDLEDYKFSQNHESLTETKAFLESLEIDQKIVRCILEDIKTVSFKGAKVDTTPKTLEGKIVQDADRLDGIGAMGIARTFAYGAKDNQEIHNPEIKPVLHKTFEEYKSKKSTSINHFHEKLLLLKERINTETGKRIADKRHNFLEKFLEEFYIEWNGGDIS